MALVRSFHLVSITDPSCVQEYSTACGTRNNRGYSVQALMVRPNSGPKNVLGKT
jgi:hypothetical protein